MSVTVVIAGNVPVTIPARATASLTSFPAWAGDNDLPEKAKLLYYRGEVTVEIGKEQIFTHIRVKTEIARVLANIVAAEDPGMYLTKGVLLTNETANVSNNPDGVFVAHDALTSKRVRLIEGKEGGFVELLGSPDVVLEIVSDSSEKTTRHCSRRTTRPGSRNTGWWTRAGSKWSSTSTSAARRSTPSPRTSRAGG